MGSNPSQPAGEGEGVVAASNRVELASSKLFGIPGVAEAYHTSILVDGVEYFFQNGAGVCSGWDLRSHGGKPSERLTLGYTNRTGAELEAFLAPHFGPCDYSLLQKNCNTFSDVALYFLLRARLDRKYYIAERLGSGGATALSWLSLGWVSLDEPPASGAAIVSADDIIDSLMREHKRLSPLRWTSIDQRGEREV